MGTSVSVLDMLGYRIIVFWLLVFFAYRSWAKECLPEIKWTNCPRRARRCDACFRIDFKNAAQDRDLMCLKEQGRGTCIFTGNLLGDRSFFSVTATNARQFVPFPMT